MTRKRLLRWLAVLVVFGALGWYGWSVLDLPPPGLLLEYGLPSSERRTGRFRVSALGIEFVQIAPGFYRMGSHEECEPPDLLGRLSTPLGLSLGRAAVHHGNECPTRWIHFSRPLWIARTEVTNREFERFRARERPLLSIGDADPAVRVSFEDAQAFCAFAGTLDEGTFRLPTEAEWEYCCRAGSTTPWSTGDDPRALRAQAWFLDDAANAAHAVGEKEPNAWGLFDMHGNASEWCSDWFGPYPEGGAESPSGPETGLVHVVRGGDFSDPAPLLRSAYRAPGPARGDVTIGFRMVWED